MITKTYRIPVENIESLKKKFSAMSRKISKIDASLVPSMEIDDTTTIAKRLVTIMPEDCRGEAKVLSIPYEVRNATITFSEDAVKADNGFAFAGSIEPSSGERNFVNSSFDVTGSIPTKYFSCDPCYCDYCKTNRRRAKTYLVHNENSGEWKQLGKECLKLFCNGLDIDAVAIYESFVKDCEDFSFISDETLMASRHNFVSVDNALRLAMAWYSENGYLATSDIDGYPNELSNRNAVQRKLMSDDGASDRLNITNTTRQTIDSEWRSIVKEVSDEELDNMKSAVKNLPDNESAYYNNLKVIVENEYVPMNKLGLLVSIPKAVAMYERRVAEEQEKENKAKSSDYIGNVGDKITVAYKSGSEIASFDTQYGVMRIYEFVADNGDVLVWKTNGCKDFATSGTLVGTIKAHEEYNGVKQTVLTRVKFN